MKQLQCVIVLVFLITNLQAQQIAKVNIHSDTSKSIKVSWADTLDALIKKYDSAKNYTNLQNISVILNRTDLPSDSTFLINAKQLRHLIDSAVNNSDIKLFDLPFFSLDKKPEQKIAEATGCPKLQNVSAVIMKKTPDADYEISFVDAAENPVSGFIFRQLNEALFYDKLNTALYGLCGAQSANQKDTAKIKSLIAGFQKTKLYEHMLEASLEVNDDDVFAGKLIIRKHFNVPFKRTITIPVKPAVGAAKSSTFKPFRSSDLAYSSISLWKSHDEHIPPAREIDKPGVKNYSFKHAGTESSTNSYIGPLDFSTVSVPATKDSFVHDTIAFTVHSIQIQFQDGFIENIKVRGKTSNSDRLLKFENSSPIPFSTRRDFRKLYSIFLYEKTIYDYPSNNRQQITWMKFSLGELLDFDQNLSLDTKDYSPVNQVLDMDIKDDETIVNLKKERTSKILEVKVYTDLKGIDNDNPNGLVQLEFSKKLNFWNNRQQAPKNLWNAGWFNYITPSFSMTKIENNNKHLPLQYMGGRQSDTMVANTYASTLNLFQYQAFRVGTDLSILTIDIPGWKSIFTLKAGIFFGRTLTVDTIRAKVDSSTYLPIKDNNIRESGINSLQYGPELCIQVFPDKRYGLAFSYKLNRYKVLSHDLTQVSDSINYTRYIKSLKGDRSKIDGYQLKSWLAAAEIYAFYKPSEYNQLFFRYRFNYELSGPKLNFHQIQIGFSTYLTHTSKGRSAEKATSKN